MPSLEIRLIGNILITILLTGIPFLWLYKRNSNSFRKIQDKNPTNQQIKMEIKFGVMTLLIFSLFGVGIFYVFQMEIFRLEFGWSWMIVPQIVILLGLHDAYFYLIHRIMHTNLLFKRAHYIHHLSHSPTPFTAFSFHPIEAFLEALIYPILLGLFSWNAAAFLIFAALSRILNITGHLGYDFFSRNHPNHPVLKWINTTLYHDYHHSKNSVNYGLYFNWWDRLLGTKDKNYEEIYSRYKER